MNTVTFTVEQSRLGYSGDIINGEDVEIGTKVIFKKNKNSSLLDKLVEVYTENGLLLGRVNETGIFLVKGTISTDNDDVYNALEEEFEGIVDSKEVISLRSDYFAFGVRLTDSNMIEKINQIDIAVEDQIINELLSKCQISIFKRERTLCF